MLTLRSPSDFQESGESALDFRAAITPIPRAIIIILMGTTGGRTIIILNHIHIITGAPHTTRITGVELTSAIIAIVIELT